MSIRHLNYRNLLERDANSNSDSSDYESEDNDSVKQPFTQHAAITEQSTAALGIPLTVRKRRRGQRNSNLSPRNLRSRRQKLLTVSGNAMAPQPTSPSKGTRSQVKQKANTELENPGQHSNIMPPKPSLRARTVTQKSNHPYHQDAVPTTPSPQRMLPTRGRNELTGEHGDNGTPRAYTPGQTFATSRSPGSDPFSSPLDPSLPNVDRRPFPFPPQTNPHQLRPPNAKAQSNSTSVTDASAKQSSTTRSWSPKKEKNDLQLSDIPIHYINFGTPAFKLPQEAQNLYNDISRIGSSFQVLPKFQDHVMHYMVDQGNDQREVERQCNRPLPNSRPDGPFEGFKSSDDFLLWDAVKTLQRAAMDCRNDGVSDSEWNSAVSYPLLKLALKGEYEDGGIAVYDVSTARIGDKTLLPGKGTKAYENEAKLVDLAMVIRVKPFSTMDRKISNLLRDMNGLSVNPSEAQYLRFNPISMPITRNGELMANLQLATWVHCQFEIMARLSRRPSQMPILPLIMIQAHSWYLLIAYKRQDEIIIFRELQLSAEGTRSVIGIFQLLDSLKRLAHWTHHDFRDWYNSNVI
ncbi:MAG: hypothetical protein Q9219_004797 [cf. Caloplaca sp. 3 TL-2023]